MSTRPLMRRREEMRREMEFVRIGFRVFERDTILSYDDKLKLRALGFGYLGVLFK